MPVYSLGTARGRIEVDASTLGRSTAALSSFGKSMLTIGAIGAVGFGLAIKAAADFETQLDRFQAVTDAPEKAMEKLRLKALELGRDSIFGARQVAEGFVELGKSGLGVQEILEGVGQAAVDLAQAGELEMARSTEILVNSLRTFKAPASEAVRFANLLAGAANASTSEVDDLGVSLRYAGPVAAQAGISFEDLSAILAVFANIGIKGSTAGTTLRGIILGLTASTPKATKVMKELGLITADGTKKFLEQDGSLKPLGETFQLLQDSMQGLSKDQRTAALNAIFQRRALAGAVEAALQGKKGFDAMNAAIGNVTAHEVAKDKLDNLQGALKLLRSTVEDLAIGAGSPLQETLKGWVQGFTSFIKTIRGLDPEVAKVLFNMLGIASVLLIVGGGFLLIGAKVLRAVVAFKEFAVAVKLAGGALQFFNLGFLANPVTAIIAIILALIAAVVLVAFHWDKVWNFIKNNPIVAAVAAVLAPVIVPILALGFALRQLMDNWGTIWGTIKSITSDAIGSVTRFVEDLIRLFQQGFDAGGIASGLGVIGTVMTGIGAAARTVVEFFTNEVGPRLSEIFRTITQNWEAFRNALTVGAAVIFAPILAAIAVLAGAFFAARAILDSFGLGFADVGNAILDVVGEIIDGVAPFAAAVASLFQDFGVDQFIAAWEFIKGYITSALQIIQGVLDIFIGIFTLDWDTFWGGIQGVVGGVWNGIFSIVRFALTTVVNIVKLGLGLLKSLWDLAWKGLTNGLQAIWDGVVDLVQAAIEGLADLLEAGINLAVELAIAAFEGFISFLEELPARAGFAIGFLVGTFLRLAIEIPQMLAQVIVQLLVWGAQLVVFAFTTGAQFMAAILTFFAQLPGRILGILLQVIAFLAAWVPMAVGKAIEFGVQFVANAVAFLMALPGRIGGILLQVLAAIISFAADAVSRALVWGTEFFRGLVDGIVDLPGTVGDILDKVIDAIKSVITRGFNAVKDFAAGLWNGFKEGLFGSPRTKIEYAIEDMVSNVGNQLRTFDGQIKQLKSLGATIPGIDSVIARNVNVSAAIGAGVIAPAVDLGATPPVQHVVNEGDEINIPVRTDADPDDIANAVSFAKKVRK